jgi:hypothetical protein
MDKEMWCTYTMKYYSAMKKNVVSSKMGETTDYQDKLKKPD